MQEGKCHKLNCNSIKTWKEQKNKCVLHIAHIMHCTLLKHSTPVVLNTNNHNFKTIKPNRTREMSIIALSTVASRIDFESNGFEWIMIFCYFGISIWLSLSFASSHHIKLLIEVAGGIARQMVHLKTFIHHQQFVMRRKE